MDGDIEPEYLFLQVVDENHEVVFQNQALRELVNASSGSLLSEKCWSLVKNDQQPCPDCPLSTDIAPGETRAITVENLLGSRVGQITCTGIAYQGRRAVVETLRPMAGDQAQNLLPEEFYQVVQQTADMVMITDRRGVIEYVNPAFEQSTGFSKEEVLGKTPRILNSGEHSVEFFKQLWQTLLSGQVFQDTLVNKKKNGERYYSEKTITPIKNVAGQITHFVSTDRDLTAQMELQLQLLQSSRLVSLGQMAAGVAHELYQPLTAISTTAEDIYLRLLDHLDLPPSQLREMMKDVLGVVERMGEVIEQLRAFSRDTAQEPGSRVSLTAVVQGALRLIRAQLQSHDIRLVLALGADLPQVEGHLHQLEQVVLNLLANAHDALDERQEGGAKQVVVRTYAQGEQVVLEVEDNGVGMAEEVRLRVFEPFFTTKQVDRGTGLGLSISYAIVRNHQGQITCDSRKGHGTTFQIKLPVAGHLAEERERDGANS